MSKNNYTGVTPDFSDVVRAIIDSVLLDVNICMPAKIEKYNKDTQYADVKIQLYQKFSDGSLVAYPVIPNVPVKHARARAGGAFIHMPLQPGDDVTLVFSQRSLDNWKQSGGMNDPADPRKHHITDAYALVGGSAINDAFKPETVDCIEIVNSLAKTKIHPDGTIELNANNNAKVTLAPDGTQTLSAVNSTTIIHPDGKYEIKGGSGDDLVKLIDTLIHAIRRSYTMTLIGPQNLIDPNDPTWDQLMNRIDAFMVGTDPLPPTGVP